MRYLFFNYIEYTNLSELSEYTNIFRLFEYTNLSSLSFSISSRN